MNSGSVLFRSEKQISQRGTRSKIFRSVLVKYPDRGLVNGDSKLFSYLFWISNFFFVFAPEANKIGIYLSRNKNVFANTYRLATFDQIYVVLIHSSRAKLCSNPDFLSTLEYRTSKEKIGTNLTDDPDLLRFGNFVTKTVVLILVLITTRAIIWKKKRLFVKVKKYNVLTFNQTLNIVIILYINNAVLDYIFQFNIINALLFFLSSEHIFTLEMLRVILIENIVLKFVMPIIFIINTRASLRSLWSEIPYKEINFFMSEPSYVPRSRPPIMHQLHLSFTKDKFRGKSFRTNLEPILEFDEVNELQYSILAKHSLSDHVESKIRKAQSSLCEIEI